VPKHPIGRCVHLDLITRHGLALQIATMTILLALTVLTGITLHQCKQLRDRLRGLLSGDPAASLDELVSSHSSQLQGLAAGARELNDQLELARRQLLTHLQHVNLVRFNAFADTGSDLSFSLALLDAGGNGVVLTSLYGRDESRIYAKPIRGSSSSYALSSEEKLAISRAMQPHSERDAGRIPPS